MSLLISAVLWAKVCTANDCSVTKVADFYNGVAGQLFCKATAAGINQTQDPEGQKSLYYCKVPQ